MNENLQRLKSIIAKSAFNVAPRYNVNMDFKRFFGTRTGLMDYNLSVSEAEDVERLSPLDIVSRMTPVFQRANTKWTRQMQVTFVENLISGCETKIQLYDIAGYENEMDNCLILDGLQRLTAMAEFQSGAFPIFNDLYWDMINTGGIFPRLNLILSIYQFSTDQDACEFYIQMNKGVTHSESDLESAYEFLNAG